MVFVSVDSIVEVRKVEITQREEKGIITFFLNGRADGAGTVVLEGALQKAIAQGNYKIVLDMSNVPYINSAAMRTLAEILSQSREHNGDLRLVGLNPKVARVFSIIGFDRFFTTYDTIEAATTNF